MGNWGMKLVEDRIFRGFYKWNLPDIAPFDFYFLVTKKRKVYTMAVLNKKYLRQREISSVENLNANEIRTATNIRIFKCLQTNRSF